MARRPLGRQPPDARHRWAAVCCVCGSKDAPYGLGPAGARPKHLSAAAILDRTKFYCRGHFLLTPSGQDWVFDMLANACQ